MTRPRVRPDELPCRHPDANPDDWFSQQGKPKALAAQDACTECPLMVECGRVALADGIPDGIWGGMDARDRERIWATWPEGKPTVFLTIIDQAVRPLLQRRRDEENNFGFNLGIAKGDFGFRADPVRA